MSDLIVNKVADSGIVTIDLAMYLPKHEIVLFDLKDYLFMGLILKEKDFRNALTTIDWQSFSGKVVAITCTADAIIPIWAYMLVSSYLEGICEACYVGSIEAIKTRLLTQEILQIDKNAFIDKRLVVKGCGDEQIPEEAYVAITHHLKSVAKSIMYGEPCSTVPIYKKKV